MVDSDLYRDSISMNKQSRLSTNRLSHLELLIRWIYKNYVYSYVLYALQCIYAQWLRVGQTLVVVIDQTIIPTWVATWISLSNLFAKICLTLPFYCVVFIVHMIWYDVMGMVEQCFSDDQRMMNSNSCTICILPRKKNRTKLRICVWWEKVNLQCHLHSAPSILLLPCIGLVALYFFIWFIFVMFSWWKKEEKRTKL